jgi:hypothetical protein
LLSGAHLAADEAHEDEALAWLVSTQATAALVHRRLRIGRVEIENYRSIKKLKFERTKKAA